MPYIGVSPQFGVRRKHTYTATAGQTSFSGAGSEGATLSYTDSNFVDVYQNGVKLGDADYTSTSGTAIVLAQGASVDDIVEIIVFDAFSAADTVSKADGDTFDGAVTFAGGVSSTLTATGRVLVDDTTEATSTTDGSLQTDGGLSVAKDIVAGDDIHLKSDSAQISFGADSEVRLDHTADTGLTLQGSGLNTNFSLLSFHTTNGTVPDLRLGKSSNNTVGTFAETASGEALGQIRFTGQDSNNATREGAMISVDQSASSTSSTVPSDIKFSTTGTERMKINGSGYFHVSQDISDSTFYNATYTNSFSHSNTQPVLFLENSGDGNVYGLVIDFTDATPDNNTSYFMLCQDNSVDRFRIWSDGDVVNHDNSYGSTSDIKLKEQIKDASSQWEDIKALKIRKYKMKEDVAKGDSDAHWRLGVIAQELETANMNGLVKDNPELVTNSDGKIVETGTTTKVVKYSILYMKAVKALQEAMTRIEALETENKTQATQIADLISRVTALENAE